MSVPACLSSWVPGLRNALPPPTVHFSQFPPSYGYMPPSQSESHTTTLQPLQPLICLVIWAFCLVEFLIAVLVEPLHSPCTLNTIVVSLHEGSVFKLHHSDKRQFSTHLEECAIVIAALQQCEALCTLLCRGLWKCCLGARGSS